MAKKPTPPPETIYTRLKYFREEVLKLGINEFTEPVDIHRSAYGRIEKGERELKANHMAAICAVYPINLNWLVTGEGDHYRPQASPIGQIISAGVTEWLNKVKNPTAIDVAEAKDLLAFIEKKGKAK